VVDHADVDALDPPDEAADVLAAAAARRADAGRSRRRRTAEDGRLAGGGFRTQHDLLVDLCRPRDHLGRTSGPSSSVGHAQAADELDGSTSRCR